jgi:hypothetical protein
MYGKTTFALIVPDMACLAMLAAAARVKDRMEFAQEMGELASDSMGFSVVVY